jgi:hypothetical protein
LLVREQKRQVEKGNLQVRGGADKFYLGAELEKEEYECFYVEIEVVCQSCDWLFSVRGRCEIVRQVNY